MATVLSPGDLAIVQYNSSTTTTDSFTFVFARDIEAGTEVNFTDNGWLAAGGFRPGEGTVTYTAPTAITAGTVVTLTGLVHAACTRTWARTTWLSSLPMPAPRRSVRTLSLLEGDLVRLFIDLTQALILSPRAR